MFADDRQDSLMKLASLQGAPLSIFVALLIAGCPLNRQQLMAFTGYRKDAITEGIATLGVLGAIVGRGRGKGWELVPNWQQLPLPLLFISERKAEKPPLKAEKPPFAVELPHTRDLLTFTTTTNLDQGEAVVVTREAKAEKPPFPVDNSIQAWLERGGVGRESAQMQALLKLSLETDYVKAHVLERLASVKAGNGRFGVGLLIVKLKAGDAAPPMRCEECLEVECHCNSIFCPDCGQEIEFEGQICICSIIRH